MTNAERFLKSYNAIDHSLRAQYNFKRSMTYSDVVRRSVMFNSVVRKYEDDLVDYGRLRNAIIHNSDENVIIAEPYVKTVEKIEYIAKLISTPPKVIDSVARRDVLCLDSNTTIKKSIEKISKSGYSNLPVYHNNLLIGVANGQRILDAIGREILENRDYNKFIENEKISYVISQQQQTNYYEIKDKSITIEQALDEFYKNRKLLVIIITENGNESEMPLGIISVSDIMDMNNILENY